MTRPAAFNKIWGYEALQITDENNEKTQEFMRTGWEGGSDKKAPSASVQNYHMQKTDQALQEVERQGCLSWRNDVPYSKGARVFFHGSTFHALKDNQDVEPQGSRDNGIWYLLPVQVYPTRYDSVEGLGTAAKHNAEDFDAMGSAKEVQQALNQLINSLGTASKENKEAFDLHGAAQTVQSNLEAFAKTLGDAAKMSNSTAGAFALSGLISEVANTKQLVELRDNLRSSAGDYFIRIPCFNGNTREYLVIQYGEVNVNYVGWRRYNSQITLPRAFTKSFDKLYVSGKDTLNAYWTFAGAIKNTGSFEYTMYCVNADGTPPNVGGNGFNWFAIGRDYA
ncbi:hypothetical protein [Zymobacter palmae]|uniref:Mu-like prophage protein n=1 Tax=Zymobacter palmae TaxID=33074 RepID=A0A348HEA1_9GAMM|nr:hypothetical protein [Zymobacter palmae]BBG29953.1 Mu-like prophage protein [Zymobacter palmae]